MENPGAMEQMLPGVRKQRVLLPSSLCSAQRVGPQGTQLETELPPPPLSPQDLQPLPDGAPAGAEGGEKQDTESRLLGHISKSGFSESRFLHLPIH